MQSSRKNLLIAIAVLYMFVLILLPTLTIFYEALHKGFGVFLENLNNKNLLEAIKLSVIITAITIPLNTVFGLCAAWVIARNQFRGKALLMSIIDLPFSVSPVVAGLMIVLLFGTQGWFGDWLKAIDVKIIFALPGMVIATIFVTLPFVAREVIPVLEEIGSEQEDAARTLGANDWQIFFRVTLPNIRWGLLYGLLLTNARAMGEFGAVSVVSGSIIGRTATLPIFVEQAYKNYQTTTAFSAALILGFLAGLTLLCKEILERRTAIKSIH